MRLNTKTRANSEQLTTMLKKPCNYWKGVRVEGRMGFGMGFFVVVYFFGGVLLFFVFVFVCLIIKPQCQSERKQYMDKDCNQ